MKKIIAWTLALATTLAVSIGATVAYLTDTDEDVNVMTIGKVKIDQLEYERIDTETKDDSATVQEFHNNKLLYPGVYDDAFDFGTGNSYVDWEQIGKDDYTSGIWDPAQVNNEVDKMVFVKNIGNYDAYVRSVFAFEAGSYTTLENFQQMVHLNKNETDWTWDWVQTPVTIGESTYYIATATYNKVLEPGAITEISLSQILLDRTATNQDVAAFGETYQVLVKSQAIQADGFADAETALTEGFGQITDTENVPFENDVATEGIDLRTALHNLNGDTNTVITSRVSNVVYGRNADYTAITSSYEGTLVDVEQDVDVYAYYVPNGDNYDVYFLADDTIYSPKDSNKLYVNMTALETVDTYNYDVSRTENMYAMFYSCVKLNNIDLSDWDTSNVTNMGNIFRDCDSMTELDVAGWNVKKVKNLSCFAYDCSSLKALDISGWNVASACEANYAFAANPVLEEIDATGTKTTGITKAEGMFWKNNAMTQITGHENWTFPNLVNSNWMFQNCTALPYIDATNWGMGNCVDAQGMFFVCTALETVEGTENWDTSNIQNMYCMFYDNNKLNDLDVSTWDTGKVTNMDSTFFQCFDLEKLDVSNWDVSQVTTFHFMFKGTGNTGDMKIKELDVSNWDTSSATNMQCMFYGCAQLKELDLSGWDVSNVTNTSHMFSDCYSLETINMSGWDTSALNNMDAMFNDCRSLQTLDVSDFDTHNVTIMSQLFENCDNLTQIIGLDQWDTSNVTTIEEMFSNSNGGSKLEVVDLSAFDTSNVTTTQWMFKDCVNLKTVYVSDKWDMSNVTNSCDMFVNCPNLVGGNGTTISGMDGSVDGTYARIDTVENPGYLTEKS